MKTENQSYYNLTAQQARHFIDHGNLLVVERVEPKPSEWFDKPAFSHGNGHSGIGWYVHHDEYPDEGAEFIGECPFAIIGETTKFREPWRVYNKVSDSYDDATIDLNSYHFRADPVSIIVWNNDIYGDKIRPAETMPDKFLRLSGKCVKVEARKANTMSFDEFARAAEEPNQNGDDIWAWFVTFEKP